MDFIKMQEQHLRANQERETESDIQSYAIQSVKLRMQ